MLETDDLQQRVMEQSSSRLHGLLRQHSQHSIFEKIEPTNHIFNKSDTARNHSDRNGPASDKETGTEKLQGETQWLQRPTFWQRSSSWNRESITKLQQEKQEITHQPFFTLKKLTPSGPQKKCGYYNGYFQGLYAAGEGNDS